MPAPTTAASRRGSVSPRTERRALATNAAIALLIAALGLVAAASFSLTTNAQVPTGGGRPSTSSADAARSREAAAAQPARSAALRAALVREVAAQRSEQLAKAAYAVDLAAREATGAVRQETLTEASKSSQAAAAQIAQQRLQEAVAARQAAQAAATSGDGTLSTDPTTTVIPSGTQGSLPVPSGVIGARFGAYGSWSRYHTGLDFRAAYGTPISAVLAGVVIYAGNSGDWAGNHVAIRHADGQTTMYSHMSSIVARVGQTVQAGTLIGYVGQTGRAFGAHLHFELYPAGVRYGDVYKAINPAPWLRSIGVMTH